MSFAILASGIGRALTGMPLHQTVMLILVVHRSYGWRMPSTLRSMRRDLTSAADKQIPTNKRKVFVFYLWVIVFRVFFVFVRWCNFIFVLINLLFFKCVKHF
jgi:hypothetical protein